MWYTSTFPTAKVHRISPTAVSAFDVIHFNETNRESWQSIRPSIFGVRRDTKFCLMGFTPTKSGNFSFNPKIPSLPGKSRLSRRLLLDQKDLQTNYLNIKNMVNPRKTRSKHRKIGGTQSVKIDLSHNSEREAKF